MRRLLLLTLCLLPLLWHARPVQAADALQLRLQYQVYAGGLRVAEATVTIDQSAAAYRMQVDAKTAGMLAMLAKWTTRVESQGRRPPAATSALTSAARLVPLRHASRTVDRGKIKGMEVAFADDGTISTRFDPPLENPLPPDEQVPPAALAGATDGLSALLSVLLAPTTAEGCRGRAPVFDGRRRFDLVLSPAAAETLPATQFNLYAGRSELCQLGFVPVAGFSAKTRRNQFWSRYGDPNGARTVPVWLGRVAGVPLPIPVRMRMNTGIGIVMAHLTRIERLDTGLKLEK